MKNEKELFSCIKENGFRKLLHNFVLSGTSLCGDFLSLYDQDNIIGFAKMKVAVGRLIC